MDQSESSRSPLNTRNNGVGVRSLLGALIPLLDDNHLLPCLSARENDGDFSGLVDCEWSVGAGGLVGLGRSCQKNGKSTPQRPFSQEGWRRWDEVGCR
jgi:hypothetical protein